MLNGLKRNMEKVVGQHMFLNLYLIMFYVAPLSFCVGLGVALHGIQVGSDLWAVLGSTCIAIGAYFEMTNREVRKLIREEDV